MEESHYLMMMWLKKRKQILLKSHIQAPTLGACNNTTTTNSSSSWEERAFAENNAAAADNRITCDECIWPPRFYPCNFCKREFRSAQALGGHMNVHRRERAKLKQSLIISPHNNNSNFVRKNDSSNSLDSQFSLENSLHSHHQLHYCSLNNSSSSHFVTSTVTTSARLSSSSTSTQENCFQPSTLSPYYSSSVSEPNKFFKGLGCDDCVDTSLSVGLNSVSVFGQKSPSGSCDEVTISYKRPKTSVSSMALFLKPCSKGRSLPFQYDEDFALGLKPGIENLDLELRVGEPQ